MKAHPANNSLQLGRGLITSMVLHVLLVATFLIRGAFFKTEAIDLSQAIRVDMVGLPDKVMAQIPPVEIPKDTSQEEPKQIPAEIPKETPKVDLKPEPVAETKPPSLPEKNPADENKINLEKSKLKQKEAFQKLKALSAIDKIKQQLESEKKLKEIKPIKGNIIAPGTALTGTDKIQIRNYAKDIDQHLKPHWALPEWLAKKNLVAKVLVRLDQSGRVLSREILQTSGTQAYDEGALQTIDQSSPLPAPPEALVDKVRVDGIVIDFGGTNG